MSGSGQDNSQWLSVTEETLFLHDGLIRVTDLVELPHDVNSSHDGEHEVVNFDSKSPVELSERLMHVCGTQNNAYSRLLEYRLNALRGYWDAQNQIAQEEHTEKDSATQEETVALLKKHGLWKEPEQASFSTRVSLLLVLPLLRSQSKVDPALCGVTAELLLSCLQDCPPLSLTKEPGDCLNGLESLLSGWLCENEKEETSSESDPNQRLNAASALVALACARGHLKTFIHTVHLLQGLGNLQELPVGDIIKKLLEMEGGQGQPSSIVGSKHILCWGFEDMLQYSEKEASSNRNPAPNNASNGNQGERTDAEPDIGRNVACDGKYLYCTNYNGRGLVKIGTGLHGTLRGYIYAKNTEIPIGWVAWADNVLLHRPLSYDKEQEAANMVQVIDCHTLKPLKTIYKPDAYFTEGPLTTINLCGDGLYIYWLWCPGTTADKNAKGQSVYLEVFQFDENTLAIYPLRSRIVLQRKDEGTVKSLNETLLSRLRPCRATAPAAALVTLTNAETQAARKDDSNTSMGIPLKTLVRTPVYCDGSSVVFLSPPPGGASGSTARSLFGSGSGLASLRSVATNLCFNVSDGQFNNRSDLIDAPTCAMSRGASVLGTGVCFDVRNNMIWCCSNDWVDQFFNPGHQAKHHILKRLAITEEHPCLISADHTMERIDVVKCLLQHVGSMCLHQINNDLLHTPLGSYILQQHPVDVVHAARVCDVLDQAVESGDKKIIICGLIVLQLLFKMSLFKLEKSTEVDVINRSSALAWKILNDVKDSSEQESSDVDLAIQSNVCAVFCAGLSTFYPQVTDRHNLLHKLLTEGDKVKGFSRLRDLILVEFADQLKSQVISNQTIVQYRLDNNLVNLILKIAVRESCALLRQCQTTDKSTFEQILSSVPMASPCQRYLMALQTNLLREVVLLKQNKEDDNSQSFRQTQHDCNNAILSLATRVFTGAYEVLEVLLESCNSIINSNVEDMEYWLQGLEKISKATILGHLLPVLLTAMTHENLRCLSLADALMPQLVQLVVLTSQAALLLKSQVKAIRHEDLSSSNCSDTDIADLIGETLNLEMLDIDEQEEQGFLAGLKIPAPWTSGKTVESIHPVRDNYKHKETVHIPGARCLYLRFDPRCSSQYDYDKLVVYAGPNTSARKVAEYGGNTFGYGSRSVLGSGWPKDLVKVEGDTVTFSFEMRSGREHNTPDKAMWGFLVTVRAQECSEEVSSGLPFLADLALGLSVLACTMLHLLYQGPEKTSDEEKGQHLLKSKLLQRCVWQSEGNESPQIFQLLPTHPLQFEIEGSPPPSPSRKGLPRIRLPTEIVHKLRDLSEKPAPQIRPSIREVIQPEKLEETVLSATIKHLALNDTVRHLGSHEEHHTEEFSLLCEVMSEVYRRLYALIRQLQTIAELEQRWTSEVADIIQEMMKQNEVFFVDYHLVENKAKELAILCFLKDVTFDPLNLEAAVTDLLEKLDTEVSVDTPQDLKSLPKTRAIAEALMEKLNLLLQVTISSEFGQGLTRSASHMPEPAKPIPTAMVRSDTEILKSGPYTRSMSAPSETLGFQDDSILDIIRLQRHRQAQKKGTAFILQDLVEDDFGKPPHVVLIDQLFSFIGSNPEQAVSSESFLAAAGVRWKRGHTRQQALVHMKELLTAATRVGGATHLVAAVTSVLQHGPRVDELTCGGMVNQVREAFAETMTSVVHLAARYPIACCNSIGLLCIIPYTRAEEKCLVRSGLVHMLDKLCSLTNYRSDGSNTEAQTVKQRVSSMAWAGFQVLSNRCVTWEQEDGAFADELAHSGLARQVSSLLTNHLARATECIGNEAAGNEALQDVLSLLNNLSRSRMGKAILSQPGCVSKLLSLLLDQRPSPKLVLIILQLCRVALPLMAAEDCDRVELPAWGQEMLSDQAADRYDKPLQIASLLLAKLGDFLVPGDQTILSSRRPSLDGGLNPAGGQGGGGEKEKGDDSDVQDGRLSVFVHKREDQTSHEVIQPLLSSSESRPFRLSGGANMEKVVRMDREMTKHGKAEVTTEDAVNALRRAAKWAQMGLVVSTGPPVDTNSSNNAANDKKKTATEVICKEKNAELARTDPVRPFISGHVANSMAAEVIALLHGLLTAPETLAAHTWTTAVEKVFSIALSSLNILLNSVEEVGSPRCNKDQLMSMAKQANAALAALGGFEETIKPGCEVQIVGEGIHQSPGQVLSVSDQTGLATVHLSPPSTEDFQPPRYSDTVQVPLSRLHPPRNNQCLPLFGTSMTETIVNAVQCLLLPQGQSGSPLSQPLPIHGSDASILANQICRVVAEIRTRACKVMSSHLSDLAFASSFIQNSTIAIDVLKLLAKECNDGNRLNVLETQCQRLRMLYRDCAKPPPPPSKISARQAKEITWHTSRSFPPVRSCLFSHGLTGVTFLGDPSVGSGLPRGTMVYATQPIPSQAPSFYWELEVCSFGDSQDESGPVISFGFMPAAEKKEGTWTNPVGSCLFHNNGRAVHYNGSSLLQWKSVRLDVTLSTGDVAGVGWERQDEGGSLHGQVGKGCVYFTYNGNRLPNAIDDVAGGMWPVIHIQKKNTRFKANFGSKPFMFAEGVLHRSAADEAHDMTQEIRETFNALPFHMGSDSDSEGGASSGTVASDGNASSARSPPGPPCRTGTIPKAIREYNTDTCLQYKLLPCYESMPTSGPDFRTQAPAQDDESDVDDAEDEQGTEDHYALLVKAWEQKVFPTIRRRFRNEAERKDGLEQIRGALQLGMTDIARQTVEFLYEENGGMPRDLHLPTIDDIKEELAKFTIERVRKGTNVVIRNPQIAGSGSTVIPKFAIRGMLKTFGLMGTVLDVDQSNELVQVETYLRSEGVLVRYWYPLDMLERPPQGYRKSAMIGHQSLDMSNIHIHQEILQCESSIARMHCRTALLELISQCNSPAMEMTSCSGLGSAMAASAALLQELDVENLQLLSNELLAPPQPHGSVALTPSLITSQTPWQCIASQTCSLSDILYQTSAKLKEELRVAIARAANQGEDYLIELSNQICMCLQTAPEMFPYEEFPVTESKVSTDVHFPGAAFVIVSCRADPKAARKDTSLYKAPWARVFTYRGHRVKKTGQPSKQEVVCFPRDSSSSSNMSDQYSPVVVPTDLVHIRVGVSPPPGVIVTIHAIPPQFPLAATYIETLVSQKYNFIYTKADEPGKVVELEICDGAGKDITPGATSPWRSFDSVVIPPPVLLHVIEMMAGHMWRTDMPALLKEFAFHLMAQTLRVYNQSEGGMKVGLPLLSPQLSPSLSLLMQLQTELRKLYDSETKNWPTGSAVGGTGIGLGIADQGRFSTYFHSLMEVCLAVAEVTAPIIPGQNPPIGPAGASALETKSQEPIPPTPTSPVAHGKRKKLKAKRERDRGSTTPKRSGSPRRPSESESSSSIPSGGSGPGMSLSSTKPEDMLWFHRALTMSQILRYLTYADPIGQGVTNDAIADAAHAIETPSAHQRLLVITGIPTNLPAEAVRNAIIKTCNAHGGLYRDELYLPVDEIQTEEVREIQVKPEEDAQPAAELPAPQEPSGRGSEADQDNKPEPELVSEKVMKTIVQTKGYAVIELRSKTKVDSARKALLKSRSFLEGLNLDPNEPVDIPEEMLSVVTVNQQLFAEQQGNLSLESFFLTKLMPNKDSHDLCDSAVIALTEIFHSCFISEQKVTLGEGRHDSGYICFSKEQIMMQTPGNLLRLFFTTSKPVRKSFGEHISHVLHRYGIIKMVDKDEAEKKPSKGIPKKGGKPSKEKLAMGASARSVPRKSKSARDVSERTGREATAGEGATKSVSKVDQAKEEERLLTLDGFLSYVVEEVRQDVRSIWRGLLICGFDIHYERSACIDVAQAQQMSEMFTVEMNSAIVAYVKRQCQYLAISPARLHPHEIYFTSADYASQDFACLQGVPIESIRLRFALLQSVNNSLETFFLPLIDLRPAVGSTASRSTASLLSQARGLIFYDTKTILMNRVLNATSQRKVQQAAPEIILDPLEVVGGEKKTALTSNFCQALRQLSNIPSSQMCVRLAAGGDPTYAFNVRFLGEEVHGTSGSFRHFLWQVARELESGALDLLITCPSAANHRSKGRYILKPGPMTYAEEKLLEFLGQLLGITLRADIPMGLDLLPVFWKNLVGMELDPITDLQDADILTYNYIKKIEMAETEDELQALYTEHAPRFVYLTLTGEEVELIPNGRNVHVNWENRQQYVDSLRCLRMKELTCTERMNAVKAGMATVSPIQLQSIFTNKDMELRTCGLPEVNLDFLKAHTMYQVGLMETDTHIQYFWSVLEGLSQEDLARFIKFACNQERIPQTCPCRDGGPETAHVPPYPMKIAPPDGPGTPDSRYIRVETCMFMIKLPQYSSEQLMKERLMYAIHCREDPLSG